MEGRRSTPDSAFMVLRRRDSVLEGPQAFYWFPFVISASRPWLSYVRVGHRQAWGFCTTAAPSKRHRRNERWVDGSTSGISHTTRPKWICATPSASLGPSLTLRW